MQSFCFYMTEWLKILVVVYLFFLIFPNIICIFPSLEMYRDLGDLADCLYGSQSCG